ncbi:MAG: TolC family protein [Leptolyngbya sp. PLA1]|nr:TolC family protein [Leptolyngbya sp. PLA1]
MTNATGGPAPRRLSTGHATFARPSLLAPALLLLASGCSSNPFTSDPDDYARQAAISRLRSVPPSDLARSQRPVPDKSATQEPAPSSRFQGRESIELTLEECRRSALAHNLSLKVAMLDPTIASERVTEEDARFESAFTLRSGWSKTDAPTASSLNSAQNENMFISPGVRIPMRTGGTVTVDLPVSRNENNNSFSTLNPSYSSDLQFSISHPLLRNAGRRVSTAGLRIAGYQAQASQARTNLEVVRQLAAADRAYWRLYRASQELKVRQQQFELATEQEQRAVRRVRAGAAAEIEITRAQAGRAERLEAIILAQNDILLQQRELKRIINLEGLGIETPTLVLTASPPDPAPFELNAAELCAQAIANRMEMLELELQLAEDAVRIGFEKNQALPLLTLDYTYRINGLGGSMQDTFHTLQRNNYEDWEIGLSAEIPLNNEAARSRVRQAILSRLQRLSTRAAREQSIRQEVLNAVDQLDASWQRILAAQQSVVLNTRAFQAEQRQFDVGQSTSTDVLDAAARLAEAQSAEARAVTDYQIAQIDLAFATGTLLGAARVSWEPAPTADHKAPAPAEALPEGLTAPAEPPPAETPSGA